MVLLALTVSSEAKEPQMMSPINGPITSDYGWRIHPIFGRQRYHSGVDIGGDYGQPVAAAANGTVIHSGWINGYGNTIIIDHGGGITTLYGHNQNLLVGEGEPVLQGQTIALCGSTGNSTGPHCHFEVRENGEPVSPYEYCPELGSGSHATGGGYDMDYVDMEFDADYNFGRFMVGDDEHDGIIQPIIKAATKGISILKDYLIAIIVVLMTIDLALGGMFKTLDTNESGGKIIKWVIAKFIWFGLLLYLMEHWGEFFGNLMKEFFIGTGVKMAGATEETVISAFTDPTIIMQKGFHLIAPIFRELQTFHLSFTSLLMSIFDADTTLLIALVELLAFVVLFIVYSCMTYQILMAYIEFYIVVLFSFISFVFAGTKYTRHISANGLNGLFAAFITLMFFCIFSVIVQTCMENITADAMFEVQQSSGGTAIVYGNGENIRDVKDMMARTRQVESSNRYDVKQSEGLPYYGAYQHSIADWDARCQRYIDETGGTLCLATDGDNFPNAPSSVYSWCPENQDKVTEFMMTKLYKSYYNWHDVAIEWNSGDHNTVSAETEEYWQKICNAKPGGMPPKVVNLIVILQLVLVSVMLLYFGSRLHRLIIDQFGSMGFKFTNEV